MVRITSSGGISAGPMNLNVIRKDLQEFKEYLRSPNALDAVFLYESQQIFQRNWDLEATDLPRMFKASFQNSSTRRLWKREGFRPLEAMDLFWELDPSYVVNSFRDLFREENAIDGRIGRFVFHADQMLAIYRNSQPASNFNSHYHDRDYWMISLYLAFRYPAQYNLYQDAAFRAALQRFMAKPIPTAAADAERYFKVSRTLYQLMLKTDGLVDAHLERLDRNQHYTGDSLLLVYEFFCVTAGEPIVP
jgi:hypothetical protein